MTIVNNIAFRGGTKQGKDVLGKAFDKVQYPSW